MSNHRPVAFLIDSSVWGRIHQRAIAERIESLTYADQVWTCRGVDLEVIYSSRSRGVSIGGWRRRLLRDAPITPAVMNRALDVAVELAESGLHRHAKPMDLVIAAAAESAGLTVLHYDRDFDHIASVTQQPTEWVAPRGSLD